MENLAVGRSERLPAIDVVERVEQDLVLAIVVQPDGHVRADVDEPAATSELLSAELRDVAGIGGA